MCYASVSTVPGTVSYGNHVNNLVQLLNLLMLGLSRNTYYVAWARLISNHSVWHYDFYYRAMLRRAHATVAQYRYIVRLQLRRCGTFKYRDHIGWNSSKIISRPNILRHADHNAGDLVQWEHPQN